MKLSKTQEEAMGHAAGGLKYVRGGYWVETSVDEQAFRASHPDRRPWHTTTHTVKALVGKGLLTWTEWGQYGVPVKVALV